MLSVPDALVILALIVFIFGGKRILEFGAGLGKGVRDFKKSLQDRICWLSWRLPSLFLDLKNPVNSQDH
jgi:sec-independent protein translocase protein TatA